MSDFFFNSYYGAVIYILIGLVKFYYQARKDPSKVNWSSMLQGYISGWLVSILLIFGGILMIIKLSQ